MSEPDAQQGSQGPGTLGLWFWGTLLAFGVFLVAVPGQDPRARFWWWAGLALAIVGLVGLVRVVLGRRDRPQP